MSSPTSELMLSKLKLKSVSNTNTTSTMLHHHQHSNSTSTSITPPLTPRSRTSTPPPMTNISARRSALHGGDAPENDEEDPSSSSLTDDSKTKKNHNLSLAFARATQYVIRASSSSGSAGWCVWPCVLLGLAVLLILSVIYSSRNIVCVSGYHPVSRVNFYGFDGLDSDFGALGVPWCKCLVSAFVGFCFLVVIW